MEQQSFAAIEKPKPQKIVIEKCKPWPDHDVDQAESDAPFGHDHLRPQRRITVHMIDVVDSVG